MKKWLAIIAVLLLLILVLVPGGMGLIAEKRIKAIAATWPTNSPFLVKILSYQRGWFSSTIQLDVTLTNPNHTPPVHIVLNEKVQHGPILINTTNRFFGIGQAYASGEIVVPVDQQAFFKQYLDQTTLFNNTLFLHLFGAATIGLTAPELAILDPQTPANRITLEGLSVKATLSPRMNHITSRSSLASLIWQDALSNVTVTQLSGHSDLSKTTQGLWLGDMNFAIDTATFNQGGKVLASIKNAAYSSASKEKDGLIHGTNQISLDGLNWHGVSYGPANVNINLQNVNAEPLAQLKRLTHAMEAQGNPAMQQTLAPHMQKLIFKVLARGMQLTINPISMQTPNGEITGQFNLSMPNLLQTADGKAIKHPHVTIPALIGGAEGSLQFTVPKAIVLSSLQNSILSNLQAMSQMLGTDPSNAQALTASAQQRANAQLQGWVAAGILSESGDNYQFSAAYQEGKLLVNGKPLFNPAFTNPGAAANLIPAPASVNTSGVPPVTVPAADPASAVPASMPAVTAEPAAVATPVPAETTAPAIATPIPTGSAPAPVAAPAVEPVPAAVVPDTSSAVSAPVPANSAH